MISILIFIAVCISLIAGIGYFVYTYGSYLIELFNSFSGSLSALYELLPLWLLPLAVTLSIALVAGFLLKVL